MTPEEQISPMLRRAAERATNDPFYLASALAAYQASERLDEAGLAAFLECTPDALTLLALCRRPGTLGETELGADIRQIVMRFAVRRDRLVHLLREVEFLSAIRTERPAGRTFRTAQRPPLLLAAQDRLKEEAEEYQTALDPGEDSPDETLP